MSYEIEAIADFTRHLIKLGFVVYLAESKTHGFYSDESGERVLSFGINLGVIYFSGNYVPNSLAGSGWAIPYDWQKGALTYDTAKAILYNNAPSWANRNPVYISVNKYLNMWDRSSRYTLVKG